MSSRQLHRRSIHQINIPIDSPEESKVRRKRSNIRMMRVVNTHSYQIASGMDIISHVKRKSGITTFMISNKRSIHKHIRFLIGSLKTKIDSLFGNQFLHCHHFPVPAFSPEITGNFIICIFCIPCMRNGNISPTGNIKVSSGRVSLKEGELPTIINRLRHTLTINRAGHNQ